MNIEPLSPAVRDYLRAFDLIAMPCKHHPQSDRRGGRMVVRDREGRAGDPSG